MRALQPDLSVADLLLNTVALEFIISIDELMFDALAPAKAKQIVASLKPVKVKMLPSWKGLDILMVLHDPLPPSTPDTSKSRKGNPRS
eukprot:748394-Pyramimonas_sp.AAC.2